MAARDAAHEKFEARPGDCPGPSPLFSSTPPRWWPTSELRRDNVREGVKYRRAATTM